MWKQTMPLQSSQDNIKVNHPSNQRHMEKEATLYLPCVSIQAFACLLLHFWLFFACDLAGPFWPCVTDSDHWISHSTCSQNQMFQAFESLSVNFKCNVSGQFVQRTDEGQKSIFSFFHKLCWTFLRLKPFLLQDKKSGSGTESQGDEVTLGILLCNIEST